MISNVHSANNKTSSFLKEFAKLLPSVQGLTGWNSLVGLFRKSHFMNTEDHPGPKCMKAQYANISRCA